MATNLLKQWFERTWVLTWGGIVLATILLVFKRIDPMMWLSVFQISATGFFGLQLVQGIGRSVAEAKGTSPPPTE